MTNMFRVGQPVKWNWGSGNGEGKVSEKFERRVQRTIKGTKVVKNGNASNPAYLVEQADGDVVLKRGSELQQD